MSYYNAIIVAGGSGVRMGAAVPKQFLLLQGLPVLAHTLAAFYGFSKDIHLVVALPQQAIGEWSQLVEQYYIQIPHACVAGGSTRFESVRNALDSIPNTQGLVAVHDGVRPLVSADTIQRSFDQAKLSGAAVPSVALVDSLRQLDAFGGSQAVDRAMYCAVQTPQTFDLSLLKEAYRQATHHHFTDDASVVEACGHPIQLIEGNRENIKITTPTDLWLAEAYLRQREGALQG